MSILLFKKNIYTRICRYITIYTYIFDYTELLISEFFIYNRTKFNKKLILRMLKIFDLFVVVEKIIVLQFKWERINK